MTIRHGFALLCLAGLLSSGCSSRSQDYTAKESPQAEANGLVMAVRGMEVSADGLSARIYFRNTTDQNVVFYSPSSASAPTWLHVTIAGTTYAGWAQLVQYQQLGFGEDTGPTPEAASDQLIIPFHQARYVDMHFELKPAIPDPYVAWSLTVNGTSLAGHPVAATVAVPAGVH
jgi:hypothetical protein